MTIDPSPSPLSRRAFLASSLVGAGSLVLPISLVAGAEKPAAATVVPAPDSARVATPKPPPLPAEMVKEFVGAAHGKLDRTREMLAAEPGLLNATWDWKAGDFEMAIGGAGHMGRRDIALFLLEHGARMDLFVAGMLGELEIVKATLTAFPALAQSKGPHGITLIAHARAGGDQAKAVLAYLEGLDRN